MPTNLPPPFSQPRIDPLSAYFKGPARVDILRLDLLHPVVSGNKWFKLQFYMQDAFQQHKFSVVTFGGAYSNHIVATAAAARHHGLQSIGLIRGEEPEDLSPTLREARSYGMELRFISRTDYRKKVVPPDLSDHYCIPEGGYGPLGCLGAATILNTLDTTDYTDIVAAVGTGTMLSGLVRGAAPHQRVTGIPMVQDPGLEAAIRKLLPQPDTVTFQLLPGPPLGRYARPHPDLFRFMNGLYAATGLPTDFVYTGRLLFAFHHLLQQGQFSGDSHVLLIHSGGLQGNRSLPKGTLIFDVP